MKHKEIIQKVIDCLEERTGWSDFEQMTRDVKTVLAGLGHVLDNITDCELLPEDYDYKGMLSFGIKGRAGAVDITYWYYSDRFDSINIIETYVEDGTYKSASTVKIPVPPISSNAFDKLIMEARDRDGDSSEPLDGDAVDDFCEELKAAMNDHEGNADITSEPADLTGPGADNLVYYDVGKDDCLTTKPTVKAPDTLKDSMMQEIETRLDEWMDRNMVEEGTLTMEALYEFSFDLSQDLKDEHNTAMQKTYGGSDGE